MLNRLLRQIAISLIAAAFAASAVGMSVFAFGFAVFAALRQWLSPAGAGAATGVIFLMCAGLALLASPMVWRRGRRGASGSVRLDGETLREAVDGALSLLLAGLASRATGLFRRRRAKG